MAIFNDKWFWPVCWVSNESLREKNESRELFISCNSEAASHRLMRKVWFRQSSSRQKRRERTYVNTVGKKVERLCHLFGFLIFLLLSCHIINDHVNPFSVIPGFYVFKGYPTGYYEVLVSMQIDFFFFSRQTIGESQN